jgi:4-amino-4-deoxy-L-arabinose transferase-like glycosyltransferase
LGDVAFAPTAAQAASRHVTRSQAPSFVEATSQMPDPDSRMRWLGLRMPRKLDLDWRKHVAWIESSRVPARMWIVLLWALLVVPAISIRGVHYEEDTVIALARGMVEDGHWLAPHYYGNRFVERPVLMSWLVAGLATIGGMNQWIIRLPTILALLAGGLMVFNMVNRRAGKLAALFAGFCFLLGPAILQKLTTAEPDVLVSVLLFAGFAVWWQGHDRGRISAPRWVAVGLVLGAAGLTKGPQPLAYFFLGVGAFSLLYRRWIDLAGLTLAGIVAGGITGAWYLAVYQQGDLDLWVNKSRLTITQTLLSYLLDRAEFAAQLALEMLPGLLVVVPFYIALARQRAATTWSEFSRTNALPIALLLYALCTTLLLVVWPGSRTRYAMPEMLAVAVAAGLAFDRFRGEPPTLVNVGVTAIACLAAYQIALSWLVMPNVSGLFDKSRETGRLLAATIATEPATLFAITGAADPSTLAYVPSRVRLIRLDDLADAALPAWTIVTAEQLPTLRAAHPEFQASIRLILRDYHDTLLVRLTSSLAR